MTAPLYKFYYRQYGVRKVTQLLKPTPIKILSLPRGSLFHYYADDDHDPAIDTSIGILAMNKSRVLVDFTTDYTGELKGIPKKKPFIVRTATREFFKENKMYRYLPDAYKTVNNDLMLFILNHSYLNTVYRYPELPMTSYYRWHNTYSTIFTKINEVATNSNKHQFIYINVPNDLPTYAIMEMYMTRESLQLLKLFDDNDKLLMLELWKWIDEEQRSNSIFNLLDEDKYNKLNIIFKYQDTEVLLNLGYLNSFIKGRPNTTEFKSISQFPVNFIKKLVLRFLINVKNIAVTSAVQATEVPEEDDSSLPFSDSEDQDDDESIVNISNTAYLAQTNKPQKEVPVEAEVDDSVDLDLEVEMGKIDEELANYSKFYTMKLVDKGLVIDKKGNLTETDKHHEVDEASPEELREKVFKARDPSEMLSQTLEELAKNDSVTISEYRKFKKYIADYNNNPSVYDKSKSTKDLIGYSKEVVQLVPENTKVTIPSVVKDTSMANISTNSFNKDYLDKLYHKDIVNVIHSIQKAGIIVKSHTVEEEVSALGEYEYHSVELAPLDGAPSTIYFKIPKINEDGTYVCSNNKYSLRNQRTDLPIRKISPTKVSLSSYYGKSFVELSRMKSNSSVEYLSKNIYRLYKEKQITNLSPGDVSDNYFKSPYIYGSLSSKFKSFTYGDYNFIFDRKLILEKVTPELLAKVEVNGDVICGHVNNSQLIVVNKNNEFHLLTKTGKEPLGNIYDILALDHKKAPIDFSEFRVYDKHVPVGVYLGYLIGLSGLIKLIGANYSKLEQGQTVRKDQYSIKFKDGTYVFDRKQSAATKLLAGFLEYSTSLKSINFKDLDDKNVYYILFEEKKMTSVYIKEMDLANELFVDPVTQSILADMGEPTTFIGLLVKATEMLDSFDYPDSQDLSQMRIRGYERISGFIYKEIAKSIKTFKNKNINGRSKVDLGPYDIWNAIMKDNSAKLVEDINPLQDIKERDVVTYVGEGGRDKGSIQKGARSYHDTDYGIISEATVDSADVSINTYLSANPGFKNLRGLVNKVEAKDTPNLLSASANLAPFTLCDDGKRVNFVNIMNSHVIATEGYEAPIVRTGYEYITCKRNSNLFAFRANKDGKVISVNSKGIIVEYADGEKVGVELGIIYGRAEGSYYPHHVVTHKKVGDVFKKDDVIAYNTKFYQQDVYAPGEIILKTVKYAKVALMENSNTFEDSSAISKNFSKVLTAKITKVKSVTVSFKQNVHNVVAVGSKVKADDNLMIIEDEISSGYNFDQKALEILQNLAQQTPSAEYSGTVENIEVYYNGDLEDMTSSLRDLALASDKRLAYARKSSNKQVITGKVNDEYRVDGIPLTLDTLEIKIYITVDNPMGVGDKGIFGNQMKSVVGEVMNYDVKTEAGESIDAIFGFKSIYNRIVLSPILMGTSATLMNVIAKKAINLYKKGK